ncbi:hypothetical protein [Pedobacter sp. UYP1]
MKVGINSDVKPGTLEGSNLERLRAAVKDKHGEIRWERHPGFEEISKIEL